MKHNTPLNYCVIGPTAIGKSDYAIQLAQKIGAEIVSVDAYQVYKHMDIGTAKVSKAQQALVPHHLIDILEPHQPYSVQDFLNRSHAILTEKNKAGIPVVFCGGTGLFVRAFLYQYNMPKASPKPELRQRLNDEYDAGKAEQLWQRLQDIDPITASRIHPNNKHHLVRALELYHITNQKPSDIKSQGHIRDDVTLVGLTADRSRVIERINQRVDIMIKDGLIDEVKGLLDKGYHEHMQALKCIGYKEAIQQLKGGISHEEMIDLIKLNTKRFSKQQMTWFKKIENVQWKNIL